jgi:hypothetical protein
MFSTILNGTQESLSVTQAKGDALHTAVRTHQNVRRPLPLLPYPGGHSQPSRLGLAGSPPVPRTASQSRP